MSDYFDRDGNPMPDDWWDKKKHGERTYSRWVTEKRVARTEVGEFVVSTVWLGLDHDYLTGRPVIFETMVFGEPWNNEMARYSTEEEAMIGHLLTLTRLRSGKPPFPYLDDDEATA